MAATVLSAFEGSVTKAREAANSGLKHDALRAPLTDDQRAAYASVRQLMDPKYASELRQGMDVSEKVDADVFRGFEPKVLEVMRTDDAMVLFRKVVQDMMLEPDEPNLIFSTIFPSIRVQGVGTVVEILMTDGIVAQLVNEAEPLGDSNLNFDKARQEIRVIRAGVQIGLTKDMLEVGEWDILGWHVRAAANALARYKEEYGFNALQAAAYPIFDNNGGTSYKGVTTGVGKDGSTANYTITHLDFVDLIAGLINHNHTPTDVFYHPLAWAGFMKDPLVDRLIHGNRDWGMAIPDKGPQPLPFALTAHMVPWMNSNVDTKTKSEAFKTDLLVVDRNRSAVLVQKADPEPTEWVDPRDDVFRKKWIEQYGVGITHGATGIVTAKGIVADANYAPYPVIRTVTT